MSKFNATLVRGSSYSVGSLVFANGKPQEIDGKLKAHLEEHAVDSVTVEGQAEFRQKFKFEPVSEEAPRTRQRKAAAEGGTDE